MGKVLSVNSQECFCSVVVNYILNKFKVGECTIIVPSLNDKLTFEEEFSNRSQNAFHKIICLEDKHIRTQTKKTLSPARRIPLLMEFIETYNIQNQENYPLNFSYDLASLIDCMLDNRISVFSLSNLPQDDFSEYWKRTRNLLVELGKKWPTVLKEEGVVESLACELNFLDEIRKDKTVIFIGVVFSKALLNFVREVYSLQNSEIILPYVDLDIKEEHWKNLQQEHYQYCVKSILDYINANRSEISLLGKRTRNRDNLVYRLFNFALQNFHENKEGCNDCDNIKFIKCESEAQEAKCIVEAIKKENGCSLITKNNSLIRRIEVLQQKENSKAYLFFSLLLCILKVKESNYEALEVLALLKHPYVNLGYKKEEYTQITLKFESKIVRKYSSYNQLDINYNIKRFHPELFDFWKGLVDKVYPIFIIKQQQSISEIFEIHICCLHRLCCSSEEHEDEISDLKKSFKGIKIFGLESYTEVLKNFTHHRFYVPIKNNFIVNIKKRRGFFLADFNEEKINKHLSWINSWTREKLGLPKIEEEKGYVYYTLHSLFCSEKLYIFRSLKTNGKINSESPLLKRLEILNKLYNKNIVSNNIRNNNVIQYQKKREIFSYKLDLNTKIKAFNTLSIRSIENLLKDPELFYLQDILGVHPINSIQTKASKKDFGRIVHQIFKSFLSESSVSQYGINYRYLISIAKQEFFKLADNHPYVKSLWIPKFKKIAQKFLKIDKARREKAISVEPERVFYWKILEGVNIISKCDRIEFLNDDSVAIIDYRTGKKKNKVDIQLFIQALSAYYTLGKEISELQIWYIEPENIEIVALQDIKDQMKNLENKIKLLLTSF